MKLNLLLETFSFIRRDVASSSRLTLYEISRPAADTFFGLGVSSDFSVCHRVEPHVPFPSSNYDFNERLFLHDPR